MKKIIDIINEAGIKDVGFCAFEDISDKLFDCRAKMRLPQNSKTVILCLFPYKVKEEKPQGISRYAAVPDYHRVCLKYLGNIKSKLEKEFCENKFESFIDNSPIDEVRAAVYAGLGMLGENGLLITEKYGSFVFIGEIVTDLEIKTEKQFKKCSLCGNCFKACPVELHKDMCLSAVSQQKRELDALQKSRLFENNIIWGCDICAESCPLNKNAKKTYIEEFIEGYRDKYVLDEDITDRAYEWRGEKTVKRNYLNIYNN